MVFELRSEEVASLASYDIDERRISIFADSDAGRETMCAIAERIGARVLFAGSVSDGAARLAGHTLGEAVLIDVAEQDGSDVERFLDQLNAVALTDDVPTLVNVVPECLDWVIGQLDAPSIVMMSQATAADWVATLAVLGIRREPVLHEVAADDSMRLQRLAEEVQRIARTLADLVGNDPVPLQGFSDGFIGYRAEPVRYVAPGSVVTAGDVRAIIRLRRMRDRYFRSDLFADPAWDMLLDLMAARLERIRVAVSSLCIAAAVPPTTALRWIKTMSDNGMFVRVADPEDGRRVFIDLSDGAAAAMTAYLNATKAAGGLAV